ncbi:MAG: YfhO family protein, partial [Planctomycetes bacterium]|nr:YfhO family protein [Planctomycetota bacterium]
MRGSAIWVGILAAVLPGMMLAPVWRLGGLCAGEDDVLYYYPARVWLHELFQKAEPPYLNPWSGLDRPMLADPQHAVFYPGTWLFLALPPKTAYPAALWLHYGLAFLGMYKLLRGMELDRTAATFGAIAFAFCGFMLAHRAHFTIQHTAAWTPWVFWRLRRFVDAGGGRRFAWACAAVAMQCLSGHIQIAAVTALGSGVYVLAALSDSRWRDLRRWFSVWAGAAVLAAVQLVPTLFFVAECTRTQRGYMDFVENSWYPQSAIGWILPMLLGQRTPNVFPQSYWGPSHQVEQFCYPGLLVLLGAAIALRSAWRSDAQRRPWVVLLLFALLTALGLFGPVAPLLYFLPGASLFRVPARAMLLFNLAAAG